jgi:hypothetical protein
MKHGAPGTVRVIEGAEYQNARRAADTANAAIHRADPSISPNQIHELKPVKFGGSPTAQNNKVSLSREIHDQVTSWWRKLQKDVTGK